MRDYHHYRVRVCGGVETGQTASSKLTFLIMQLKLRNRYNLALLNVVALAASYFSEKWNL